MYKFLQYSCLLLLPLLSPQAAQRALAQHVTFAQGADGSFIHNPHVSAGCNGRVNTSAKMANGDVIFGGNFTRCGAVRANRVVRFDGTNFFSLGAGLENGLSGEVRAVFVDGAKVYAGGHFKLAGQVSANNVAVFEAGTWRSIGRGASNGVSGYVRSLQTFQGKLYVGGYEYVTASRFRAVLREWNGAGWRDVIASSDSAQFAIQALASNGTTLYFGGTFELGTQQLVANLGSFDGTSVRLEAFPGVGASFSRIRDLHLFQGRLCAAGSFTFPTGAGGGGGVACQGPTGSWLAFATTGLRALGDDGTSLYAAGFASGRSVLIKFGLGFVPMPELGLVDYALTLASQNGDMLIGGELAQRKTAAQGLLRYRAGVIEPVFQGDATQLTGGFSQLATSAGKLIGYTDYGGFSKPDEYQSMAIREGDTWRYLETPTLDDESYLTSLLNVQQKLFLSFSSPTTGDAIYEWTGVNWLKVSAFARVNAVYGQSLIALPEFSEPNGTRTIRRFDGVSLVPWLEIPILQRNGQNLTGQEQPTLPLTIVEYQGRPVIAGQFDAMAGVGPVGGVATYFDGAWHPLGNTGLTDPKWAFSDFFVPIYLQIYRGELYASNGFTFADGQPVDGIARFDGTRWQAVGGGIVQSDNVAARADVKTIVYQDKLYAYGTFDQAGGSAAHSVAQWDGTQWRALRGANGEGFVEGSATKAVIAGGDLVFTGELHEAGGEAESYLAIWRGSDAIFAAGFE
jgi:trimeric autotransporter adhesin